MGAWAKMKEDSDSVNGRTAAAVGHCALVPDITDMVMHPLGLHLTLDFVDTFLDRRFHCVVLLGLCGLRRCHSHAEYF